MAALNAKPRKTVEDFLKLPEGSLAELIDGELLMTPSPRPTHQRIVANILFAMESFLRAHPSVGTLHLSPLDVHLPSGDIVEPDLIYVSKARTHIVQDWIRGAPDLLIEVVSPVHPERDLFVKRNLYARNGVLEYWIVQPDDKAVEVLRLSDAVYQPAGWFRSGEIVTTPLLPGFLLPVDAIFTC
jgi:Uma2 family endonuclease